MKKYLIFFVVCVLLSAFGGPLFASTSGDKTIQLVSGIITLGFAPLAIIFGLIAVKKSTIKTWLKIVLGFLAVIVSIIAIPVASLMF